MAGVFVTGATGIVGSAVVRELVRLGEPVIAAGRDPDRPGLARVGDRSLLRLRATGSAT